MEKTNQKPALKIKLLLFVLASTFMMFMKLSHKSKEAIQSHKSHRLIGKIQKNKENNSKW
jgi:hypothetical protein